MVLEQDRRRLRAVHARHRAACHHYRHQREDLHVINRHCRGRGRRGRPLPARGLRGGRPRGVVLPQAQQKVCGRALAEGPDQVPVHGPWAGGVGDPPHQGLEQRGVCLAR